MSNQKDRLIAKIQHFYENLMERRKNVKRYLGEVDDDIITNSHYLLVDRQYSELINEYNKVFHNLVYSEK